jgi:hypothetical protein
MVCIQKSFQKSCINRDTNSCTRSEVKCSIIEFGTAYELFWTDPLKYQWRKIACASMNTYPPRSIVWERNRFAQESHAKVGNVNLLMSAVIFISFHFLFVSLSIILFFLFCYLRTYYLINVGQWSNHFQCYFSSSFDCTRVKKPLMRTDSWLRFHQ